MTSMDTREKPPRVGLNRVSRSEVFARLDSAHVESCRLERERLRAILECDRHDLWRNQGARDHAEFLAGRYGISKWKARRLIGAAYALEYLPRLSKALEAGVINIDKAIELSRFATRATEKKLITWAKRVSAACIRGRADEETRVPKVAVEHSELNRYLTWNWSVDGQALNLDGWLSAADGHTFIKAIENMAKDIPADPTVEELPGIGDWHVEAQRNADALVALCSAQIATDQTSHRPTIVVHAPAEALVKGTRNARIEGGPVVSPQTAQRLSCDGRIEVVSYSKDGKALDLGRAAREPSPALRRQVFHRDFHTCTFDGCEMKSFLIAHHVDWWGRDHGETKLENLVTVCHFHHKLVHEHRWSVILENGTTPVWFRPSGRRYEPGPAPPQDAPPEPDPSPQRSDGLPWPQLWHWLHQRDDPLNQNETAKRFIQYMARGTVSEGGLRNGLHGLRTGDAATGVLHADATAIG